MYGNEELRTQMLEKKKRRVKDEKQRIFSGDEVGEAEVARQYRGSFVFQSSERRRS